MPQVIVVGGGLAGCSAAHTILEAGHSVVLIDKKAFLGGNSVKATSGINGAGTSIQKKMNIADSAKIFEEDTIRSATGVKVGPCPPSYSLGKVLTHDSAPAVNWLNDKFNLGLDTVSRLGGHSFRRTHRSLKGGKFPGMMITMRLVDQLHAICKDPKRARIITRARVNKLLTDSSGRVVGCQYEKGGQSHTEHGPVLVATGGYGAGVLFDDSMLKKIRPELGHLPTTNGDHCTGDGIEISTKIGAGAVDLKHIQVHPTGLVAIDDPDCRTKFLAAGALRGEGGILINNEGKRFTNDLGTRDFVTGSMWDNKKPPFRLVLNSRASNNIAWHCKHYLGRKVMQKFDNGYALATEMGIQPDVLKATFEEYNESAKTNKDPYGLKFFAAAPIEMNDSFHVAVVTPVVHYTMGGLLINDKGECLYAKTKKPVPGLWAAGEVAGGVHGKNRLGGSALLECVVFGRVSGASAVKYLNSSGATASARGTTSGGATASARGTASGGPSNVKISIKQPNGTEITVSSISDGEVGGNVPGPVPSNEPGAKAPEPVPLNELIEEVSAGHEVTTDPRKSNAGTIDSTNSSGGALKEYTMEEVAKHKMKADCWVVVNDQVLDVTNFLDDHPGGPMAIMTFAGRDATEEFNMLHDSDVIEKYAPEVIIGTVKKGKSKL